MASPANGASSSSNGIVGQGRHHASSPAPSSSQSAAAAIQQGFQANASQHLAANPFRAPGAQQHPATPSGSGSGPSSQSWATASGIDLRAEEEALRANNERQAPVASSSSHAHAPAASSSSSSSSYLQLYPLAQMVYRTSSDYSLSDVEPDVLNILSAGARIRFRNLLEGMVRAARHRCWSDHEREPPTRDGGAGEAMYHEELLNDPSKWVAALEKAERGEENALRRRRAQLRAEREAKERGATAGAGEEASGAAAGEDDEDGGARKKAKLAAGGSGAAAGPSTPSASTTAGMTASMTAKNMSEDVRRRLANNTANRALGSLGGTMPKWMTMGASSTPGGGFGSAGGGGDSAMSPASNLPKPRFAPQPPAQLDPATSRAAPTGLAGSPPPPPGSTTVNPQGWGELSLRTQAKLDEERKKRRRVLLQDAFHALEMERRNGGGGSSGGDRVVLKWRALGGSREGQGGEGGRVVTGAIR